MKFTIEEFSSLGSDLERIRDFYRSEEPVVILQVYRNPALANLGKDGQKYLQELVEDSIILEQHIAFRGLDEGSMPVFSSIIDRGLLYQDEGSKRPVCRL
jgi:hypothetical protein